MKKKTEEQSEEQQQNKKQPDELSKSTHDRYTKIYIEILESYKKYIDNSVASKINLKNNFFITIQAIMMIMTASFVIILVLSIVIIAIMTYLNKNSAQIITNSIVAIISSFVTMVLSLLKLPQIIADYLYNKDEDEQMNKIIGNIQTYELNTVKEEKMLEKAKVDAVIETDTALEFEADSLSDSPYVDSSTDNNVSKKVTK